MCSPSRCSPRLAGLDGSLFFSATHSSALWWCSSGDFPNVDLGFLSGLLRLEAPFPPRESVTQFDVFVKDGFFPFRVLGQSFQTPPGRGTGIKVLTLGVRYPPFSLNFSRICEIFSLAGDAGTQCGSSFLEGMGLVQAYLKDLIGMRAGYFRTFTFFSRKVAGFPSSGPIAEFYFRQASFTCISPLPLGTLLPPPPPVKTI